jgi:apolipoprotein D and lipocalin family protein
MRIPRDLYLVVVSALLVAGCRGGGDNVRPPETVPRVDLTRYQGLWYEVAKIPNRFQKSCVADTTAEYRLLEGGEVSVLNRCRTADGDYERAEGIARVVDLDSNARLEVSFVTLVGWHLFWGDYWILQLDPDYRYAVVGEPGREYGWILSRTPQLSPSQRAAIDRRLREQGYDPDSFVDSASEAGRHETDKTD